MATATSEQVPVPAAPPRGLVPALALAALVNLTSALGLGPFLPVIAQELGTPVALLGQIPAVMMVLAAMLGLVAGPLADHFGYRRALMVSMLSVVASAAATGLAPTFPLLLLVTLVGAVGRAAVTPVAQAIAATRFPEENARRRALSWVTMGSSGSVVLGLPLLATIASFSHWRVAFFVLSGVTLGLSWWLGRLLRRDAGWPTGRPGVRNILAAYVPLRRHRPTLCLLGANLLSNAGIFVTWGYAAVFLAERYGLDTREVGWVYLVAGLGAVLGSWLAGGRLGARPRPTMIALRIGAGLVLALALLLPLPILTASGLFVLSMLLTTPFNIFVSLLLVAESPAGRATTLTCNYSALSLGQGLGGALGGLALVLGGWAAVGLSSFALMLAAAALVWWSGRREAQAPTPVAE